MHSQALPPLSRSRSAGQLSIASDSLLATGSRWGGLPDRTAFEMRPFHEPEAAREGRDGPPPFCSARGAGGKQIPDERHRLWLDVARDSPPQNSTLFCPFLCGDLSRLSRKACGQPTFGWPIGRSLIAGTTVRATFVRALDQTLGLTIAAGAWCWAKISTRAFRSGFPSPPQPTLQHTVQAGVLMKNGGRHPP